MSTVYPFQPPRTPTPRDGSARPPRVDPREPLPQPGSGAGRPPRVDPPPGPVGPGYNTPPGRAPRVDPPVGPQPVNGLPNPLANMPAGTIDQGMPAPYAPAADDVRGQALAKLLGRAAQAGDRGDSTKTLTDLLMGVDMGGAARATGEWATRQRVLTDTGDRYTSQLAAALKAMRAKIGTGGGGGRSGGGGGGGLMPAGGLSAADMMWLDDYMKGLTAPKPAPGYKPPTPKPAGPSGYGASQHPVQYRPKSTPIKKSKTKAVAS